MATEHTFVDKTAWGPGPWTGEPDYAVWRDAATGYPCLIVRSSLCGSLCGYVGVPPGHPAHGLDDDADLLGDVRVHGGLTFAGPCQPVRADSIAQMLAETGTPPLPDADLSRWRVCHVTADGEDEPHWFGFDCAHFMDLSPAIEARFTQLDPDRALRRERVTPLLGIVYRDRAYVEGQCASLAAQLRALA